MLGPWIRPASPPSTRWLATWPPPLTCPRVFSFFKGFYGSKTPKTLHPQPTAAELIAARKARADAEELEAQAQATRERVRAEAKVEARGGNQLTIYTPFRTVHVFKVYACVQWPVHGSSCCWQLSCHP